MSSSASGYRHGGYGTLVNVGASGYAWSSSPYSAASAYGSYMVFNNSEVNPENNYHRSYGRPVRCVQE